MFPSMRNQKRYLSTGQVAEMLEVTTQTVRRWAEGGFLRYVKSPSGRYRFFSEDFDAANPASAIRQLAETA